MNKPLCWTLAALLAFPPDVAPAFAQRGGGRAAGAARGGGRTAGGVSAGRPSFNRTPSFTPPSGGRPGGPGGGARPSTPTVRPTPGNRPNLGGRPGGGGPNRPGAKPARPPIAGPPPGLNPARRPAWGPGGAAGRPPTWGDARPPAWASRPGWNYHRGWVNGYWHGRNNNWWNNGGAFFTGMAIGGIGAWGLNSAIYGWGYRRFYNPYAVAVQPIVVQQPIVVGSGTAAAPAQAGTYDYSEPLVASAPPEPGVADPAIQAFDGARAAFRAGDYDQALKRTDEALKSLPDDAAMHEFRALCFFAMKDYDQAAGVLYAVLSVGPGWDWTTLIGLYPSVDVYTAQLRALEDFRTANPRSASSRFVLGYHYLSQGHTEAAITEFKDVVALQPSDRLSAQLVELISGNDAQRATTADPAPPPAERPGAPPAAFEGDLVGAWKASPEAGVSIALTITKDGDFTWNLTQQGKSRPIAGKYNYGSGILTLARSDDDVMVGKVTWKDAGRFVFQAMGGGPDDPGLTFSKE